MTEARLLVIASGFGREPELEDVSSNDWLKTTVVSVFGLCGPMRLSGISW